MSSEPRDYDALYDGRYLGNGTILATWRYGFDRGGFGGGAEYEGQEDGYPAGVDREENIVGKSVTFSEFVGIVN